jgi:hypothetical protein
MTSQTPRARLNGREMLSLAVTGILSTYLGFSLFSFFEPTLIRGVMQGLRIFLGITLFVLGLLVMLLGAKLTSQKQHRLGWFVTLTIVFEPLVFFGFLLALDTLVYT